MFGTNPIAFGFPVENSYPLIADFATSTMSHGDLQLTAQRNEAVPAATGVGQNGRETTDPQEILTDGALLPFGGHKGALLSLLVEVLGSALTGGAFSYETEAERPEGSVTSRTGQFLLIVDPDRDLPAGSRDFPTRISQLLRMLRQQGMDRLPGDRRHLTRLQSEEKGIPVTDTIRALLNDDI